MNRQVILRHCSDLIRTRGLAMRMLDEADAPSRRADALELHLKDSRITETSERMRRPTQSGESDLSAEGGDCTEKA